VPAPARWPATSVQRRPARGAGLRHASLGLLLLAADAIAQLSGTVSVTSDYRYRGVSLSRGDPAAQASLAYDDVSGLYAGLFGSNVQFAISPHRELELVPYAGYVRRFASGVSGEIGVDYAAFTGPGSYDYAELYAGVANDRLSARLYYARRYFGRDAGAIYAEANAAQPLADRIRLLAHIGVLRNLGGESPYGPTDREVIDGRLGVAVDVDRFTVQASWVGVSSASTGYPISGRDRRNTAVATLSLAF